jgi:hypothetical protein
MQLVLYTILLTGSAVASESFVILKYKERGGVINY